MIAAIIFKNYRRVTVYVVRQPFLLEGLGYVPFTVRY